MEEMTRAGKQRRRGLPLEQKLLLRQLAAKAKVSLGKLCLSLCLQRGITDRGQSTSTSTSTSTRSKKFYIEVQQQLTASPDSQLCLPTRWRGALQTFGLKATSASGYHSCAS